MARREDIDLGVVRIEDLTVNGAMEQTGDFTLTGDIDATGDVAVTGDSEFTGAVDITGAVGITGTTTQTGDIELTGDIDASGDIEGATGTITTLDGTTATFTNFMGGIEIPLSSVVPTAPSTGCRIYWDGTNLKAITTSGKLATLNNAGFSS